MKIMLLGDVGVDFTPYVDALEKRGYKKWDLEDSLRKLSRTFFDVEAESYREREVVKRLRREFESIDRYCLCKGLEFQQAISNHMELYKHHVLLGVEHLDEWYYFYATGYIPFFVVQNDDLRHRNLAERYGSDKATLILANEAVDRLPGWHTESVDDLLSGIDMAYQDFDDCGDSTWQE